MGERNTDVTTFSKTFQEKQKTFPYDPQDLFQIALLYIDFQTNARDYTLQYISPPNCEFFAQVTGLPYQLC